MVSDVMTDRLPRAIEEAELAAYRRDGAAALRGILDSGWIDRMRVAIDRILAAPGSASVEYTPKDKPGRYYGDFFIWRRDPDFAALMAESPLPELAARVMDSSNVHFFYDQLLVKEPNTAERTPWHHDLPYWPIRGEQIMSVWVPFDPVDLESGAVQYIQGSHTWGKMYAPSAFGAKSGFAVVYARMGLEPLPDVDANLDQYELLHWDLAPGDVLIHHPLTIHGAPGNRSSTTRRRGLALRYVGDDCVYDPRPGTFMENPKVKALLPEIRLADGDPMGGELFPRVWPRS